MKKVLGVLFLTGLFLFIASVSGLAQSDMAGKKYDNPQWKNVILIDYKAGMADKARKIVNDYYKKAGAKAGTPGPEMILVLHSGEYDLMVVWGMSGGIEDMNWDVNPNNIKWRKALNELAGGEEKAAAMMKEYSSCINKSTNYIARVE